MLHRPLKEVLRTTNGHLNKLKDIGVTTVQDLLLYFPRRYTDRSDLTQIVDLSTEEVNTVKGILTHLNTIRTRNGKLSFWINDRTNRLYFDKYKVINVRNSFGKSQKRYSIMTRVTVGDSTYKVFISLTNRKDMKYPVLIGRRFLYKFNYIVDVRKKNINDRAKKV